ncbi:alpha/beta fold hydrolase [Pelagibius sp. Alg239-R121]|uniref:alpha/beta fold hydrolase n=1 Tax=Pelagibius sp. Alg239-R121 TaxID=2993448 RepID=UPI0024A7A143|nr:alpha/beta hydrolase [Pelagibius sp. Alg239-R121]
MLPLDNRFQFNGQSVAWGCIGQGDPLVMVHGFPWSSQAWRHIAPHLTDRRSVYYFDMIGCGQSEISEGQNVSAAVQNDLLATLLDHWSLDCPEMVAHDFGGLAALRGHYVNGLRYRRLTLIDAVAVLPSGSPFFAHVREHEEAFAQLPAYAHDALFRAYIQRAAHKNLREEAIEIYAQAYQGEIGQPAFYRQIAQSDTRYIEELQDQYGPMDCNVDIVWGEQDSFIPLNQGEQLAAVLGANSLTRVGNAGHILQEDAPEAIVAALLRA